MCDVGSRQRWINGFKIDYSRLIHPKVNDEQKEIGDRVYRSLGKLGTRFVTTNYERARGVLESHKAALLRIAEELLAREVLDAEQVRRILAGEPLEEHTPRNIVSATDDGSKRTAKERPSMVPPLPPLNKPLPQE